MIWQNLAKNLPNKGVAVPRAPVAPGDQNPLKSLVMGLSLLVNCYLEIKTGLIGVTTGLLGVTTGS